LLLHSASLPMPKILNGPLRHGMNPRRTLRTVSLSSELISEGRPIRTTSVEKSHQDALRPLTDSKG
jgi:hypothetical protein